MGRFVRLVAASQDTPTLIQRIAEHYPNMVYCSAFVTGENSSDAAVALLHEEIKKEIRRLGLSYERVHEKLTAVAAVLGLGKTSPGSGQLNSIQMNYYDILGISPGADTLEVKKAYRAKALQTHPDTAGTLDSSPHTREEERFLAIQEAYNVLSDPILKRHYDVSRNQKNLGQWSEDETGAWHGAPLQKAPSAMRLYGYPLLAVILLLAGVTVIADMAIRESSLNDGLGTNKTGHMASAVNASTTESTGQDKGEKAMAKKDSLDRYPANPAVVAGKLTNPETKPENIPEETTVSVGALQQYAQVMQKEPLVATKSSVGNAPTSLAPSIKAAALTQLAPSAPAAQAGIVLKTPEFKKALASKTIEPVSPEKKSQPVKEKVTAKPAAAEKVDQTPIEPPSVVTETGISASKDRTVASVTAKAQTDFTIPLKVFLNQYSQAYNARDIDQFLAFFSENAVENNTPLRQLIPSYQKNFSTIPEIEYNIDMANYTLDLGNDRILLNGRFAMKWVTNGDGRWRRSSGKIQMGLVANGDSFLVQKLSYQFDKD